VQILRTCEEKAFAVIAMVFMPDHLHMLVEGTRADCEFRSFMRLLRQRTAIAGKQALGKKIWDDGYYERVLRDADDALGVVRYIRQNPVVAGLASTPDGYPYLWAV
jgi:putative transposase